MLLLLTAALAQETAPVTPQLDFSGLFIRMIILLLLIVLLGFLLIRFVGRRGGPGLRGQARDIEVISWHRLTPKSLIYTVQIEQRRFALGVTEQSVNLIAELTADNKATNLTKTDKILTIQEEK